MKSIAASLLWVCALSGQEARDTGSDAIDRAIERLHARIAAVDIHQEHSSWSDPWVVRTDHFELRTTVSYAYGHDLAVGLENMLGHFRTTLASDFEPSQRFQVRIYPDLATYNQFGDTAAEHSSFYGSFYAGQDAQRPVAVLHGENLTLLRMQLTHSVVHQWLAAAYPGVAIPTWIDEGLASYFSLYWGYEWGRGEFVRLKGAERLLPVAQLMGDPLTAYTANDSHTRFMELGMLFYYLLRFREDTRTTLPGESEQRAAFRDYLEATLRGQRPPESAATRLLADPARLQADFFRYEFPKG